MTAVGPLLPSAGRLRPSLWVSHRGHLLPMVCASEDVGSDEESDLASRSNQESWDLQPICARQIPVSKLPVLWRPQRLVIRC